MDEDTYPYEKSEEPEEETEYKQTQATWEELARILEQGIVRR